MGGQRYTIEQLENLRQSPLVQKPDGLPSIEQWMDVPADQANIPNATATNRRPRSGNHGEGATTNEIRADRPILINAGGMGHFGRRPSTQPEDMVFGPPKLAFTSASRAAKAAEISDKRGAVANDGESDKPVARQRGERWPRDRDGDANRDKTAFPNGRRVVREDGEGWTNVKGRKSLGQDDFDRGFGRNGDREREKPHRDGDADNAEVPARRGAGAPREKFERWGRRDETNTREGDSNKFTAGGQGGWRDRERDRDNRDRDRDWTRGGTKIEEDPEWMDTNSGKEKKQAHTVEEFERWKEQMRAKETPTVEKDEPKAYNPVPAEPTVPATASTNAPSKPAITPSAIDITQGSFFGNWGREKGADANASPAETVISKPNKEKKSRFMQMFDKPQEPLPPSQPVIPTPASPGPAPNSANGGDDADKQGFQRILQMLGGTNLSAGPAPQQTTPLPINGARQGDFQYQQSPPHEERQEIRPQRQQVPRTLEQQTMLDNILAPRPDNRPSQTRIAAMSSENIMFEQMGAPRAESSHVGGDSPFPQPPPRNSSAQDAHHLHALLNSRAQQETNRDPSAKQRERDFLLNLMQQPSRQTPPQSQQQNPPRQSLDSHGMQFFDQIGSRPYPQAKTRGGVPPAFMDDPRFLNEAEMMRREQQAREASLRDQLNRQQREEAMRAKNSHLPLGFNPNHDDPAIASLQRRNTAGEVPRQMTNMGIPSQPVPDMQMFAGRSPGMPPTPQERSNIPPPPGFGVPSGMRQPLGLAGLNGPQQMPSFSAGNTPLVHPPGFGPPPGNMRGMFPAGPGQNPMPQQGPPQGYFPPPGYGLPMPMRGEDPRMMMGRPEFEQYGGPAGRQPGRPPNMY